MLGRAMCGMVAVGAMAAAPGAAQDDGSLSWDLQSDATDIGGELRSGDMISLVINGANPACWELDIEIEVLNTKPPSTEPLVGIWQSGNGGTEKVPTPQDAEDENVIDPSSLAPASDLADAAESLNRAMATARQRSVEWARSLDRLADAVRDARTKLCGVSDAGNQAIANELGKALDAVEDARTAFHEAVTSVRSAAARFQEIRSDSARALTDPSPADALLYHREMSEVTRKVAAAQRGAQSAALAERTDTLTSTARAIIARASSGSDAQVRRRIQTTGRTEGVVVTVEARRHPEIGEGTVTRKRQLNLQVTPRWKGYITTGWMVSTLDEHHYVRAELPTAVEDPDAADTRSAFIDQADGDGVAHGPLVLAHGLWDLSWGESELFAGVSAGLTARTVNGVLLPEPVLGASILLGDLLTLTAGYHVGRIETLNKSAQDFPGDLPDAVTGESVIGTEWSSATFLAFSVVVP